VTAKVVGSGALLGRFLIQNLSNLNSEAALVFRGLPDESQCVGLYAIASEDHLFAVMKRKNKVRPIDARKNSVRSTLSLHLPTDPKCPLSTLGYTQWVRENI